MGGNRDAFATTGSTWNPDYMTISTYTVFHDLNKFMDGFSFGVAHIKQKKGLVPGGPDLANPELNTNRGYLHSASHGCHDS